MAAFEYEKDFVCGGEVGVGKMVPYKNLIPNDARLFVEKSGGALSDDAFWVKMGDPHYIEKEEEHEEEEDEDAQCVSKKEKMREETEAGIVPLQMPYRELQSRVLLGKKSGAAYGCRHLRRPERMNIQDISLNRYASFLEIVAPPKRKKSERFPDSVKSFLKKLYDEGERTGAKIDAREAEQ
uniref:Uncharacterized protein n=1 Tax=Pristionchus pacificus TaxID=54126 RepID=A0A8R1Z0R0_PRIPA